MGSDKPVIALFTGDPAGIGPELVEAMLKQEGWRHQAQVLLIAQHGALSVPRDVKCINWVGQNASPYEVGQARKDNGLFMLQGLSEGLKLLQSNQAQAFCFAPLNKSALRLGGMTEEDELRWFAKFLDHTEVCGELNVLRNLWTSRVTSHVALREVSSLLTPQKVVDAITMITDALRASGIERPRIAVCGLNPHNGDHGNYGNEEELLIEPAVALARELGYPADGPFPADTAFVRALRAPQGYDGVVTMYHDQGQIAMKLLGFEQGVTVHGGLPYPITTPAHGTAYDIARQGLANPQAMISAFSLAVKMASSRQLALNASHHR